MDNSIALEVRRRSFPRTAGDGDAALPASPLSTVQIYLARLDVTPLTLNRLRALLNREEHAWADRFYFDRDRHRFIAAHGFLRIMLARHLHRDPADLEFGRGLNGKPALVADLARIGLHFNLTHSEDLVALAVTTVGPVGIDLEHVRRLDEFDALVDQFFSARESTLFRQLPPAQKPAAFFALWTRKEAWLKATGEGIGRSLRRVEVTFLPGEPAALLALPPGYGIRQWQLSNLNLAGGCAAAVALRGPAGSLTHEFRLIELESDLQPAEARYD